MPFCGGYAIGNSLGVTHLVLLNLSASSCNMSGTSCLLNDCLPSVVQLWNRAVGRSWFSPTSQCRMYRLVSRYSLYFCCTFFSHSLSTLAMHRLCCLVVLCCTFSFDGEPPLDSFQLPYLEMQFVVRHLLFLVRAPIELRSAPATS